MKNNKGFSLVELIVVIAIMAILATVAVIGVSVYIPKAQKANDAELVNDIIYAVTLRDYETQFASNGNGVVGYVVITEDSLTAVDLDGNGDTVSGGDIHEAMVAAFGANYANELHLAFDGWTDAAKLIQIAADNEYADSIGSSSFVTGGTDKLLGDVQNTVGVFAGILDGSDSLIKDLVTDQIDKWYLADGSGLQDIFGDRYTGNDLNKEVVANGVILGIANQITTQESSDSIIEDFMNPESSSFLLSPDNELVYRVEDPDNASDFVDIANKYAALESLVTALKDQGCTDIFNDIMDEEKLAEDAENNYDGKYDKAVIGRINDAVTALNAKIYADPTSELYVEGLQDKALSYYAIPDDNGLTQAAKDAQAYLGIMSAVNEMKDDYLDDPDAMNNGKLFTDTGVGNQVNTFITFVSLGDVLDDILGQIGSSESVVVLIVSAENGNLVCAPCPAEVIN